MPSSRAGRPPSPRRSSRVAGGSPQPSLIFNRVSILSEHRVRPRDSEGKQADSVPCAAWPLRQRTRSRPHMTCHPLRPSGSRAPTQRFGAPGRYRGHRDGAHDFISRTVSARECCASSKTLAPSDCWRAYPITASACLLPSAPANGAAMRHHRPYASGPSTPTNGSGAPRWPRSPSRRRASGRGSRTHLEWDGNAIVLAPGIAALRQVEPLWRPRWYPAYGTHSPEVVATHALRLLARWMRLMPAFLDEASDTPTTPWTPINGRLTDTGSISTSVRQSSCFAGGSQSRGPLEHSHENSHCEPT